MTIQSQSIVQPFVLSDVVRMSKRQIFIVALTAIACAFLAVGVGVLLKPSYKATTQLYLDPRDLKALDNQVTPTAEAQNIGVTLVETQALVLSSDGLLDQVVKKLDLANDPEFNGSELSLLGQIKGAVSGVVSSIMGGSDTKEPPEAIAFAKLRKAVDVFRIDRSYIISASAKAETRAKAELILKTLVQSFLEEQSRSRSDAARRTSEDIDKGIDALREDLGRWEKKVARYKEDNNLVGVRGQIVTEQQLADLNGQLITAQVDAERLKARLDATPSSASNLDRLPEAVASQTLQSLRDLLARISQRKASLAAQLRPRHPDMRAIVDSENQVKAQIAAELSRIRSSLDIAYRRSRANVTALKGNLEELRKQLNADNKAQIQLRELERKLEAARSVYGQAIIRAKETSEQARLNTANVRVVSQPRAEQRRSFPPPLPLLAAIGLLFGAIIAFLIMHLRALFRSPRVV